MAMRGDGVVIAFGGSDGQGFRSPHPQYVTQCFESVLKVPVRNADRFVPDVCVFFFPSSVPLNAIIKANESQLLDSLITWNADR